MKKITRAMKVFAWMVAAALIIVGSFSLYSYLSFVAQHPESLKGQPMITYQQAVSEPVLTQTLLIRNLDVPMPAVSTRMKISAIPEMGRCVLLLDSNHTPIGQNCNTGQSVRGIGSEMVITYLRKIPGDRDELLVAITVCPKDAPMSSSKAGTCQ